MYAPYNTEKNIEKWPECYTKCTKKIKGAELEIANSAFYVKHNNKHISAKKLLVEQKKLCPLELTYNATIRYWKMFPYTLIPTISSVEECSFLNSR